MGSQLDKTDFGLSLVSTDALITELLSRFDSAVIVGMRDEGTTVDEQGTVFEVIRYRGDYHVALGLLSRAEHLLNRDFESRCQESDGL